MQQTPATGTEADPHRCLQIVQGSSLGCGSFAVVYRATWRGVQCALKVLRPEYSNSEHPGLLQADMLRREGSALMRHPHRFLARCLAVIELPPTFPGLPLGYQRPVPALVLELMEEGSLQRLLRRQQLAPWRPLYDTATALEWATQIASALAHLHGQSPPVIHRDIKPDNVLLTGQQQQQPQQQQPQRAGPWQGGGTYGRGRTAVAKLVDLGLHTSPRDERHQRQPLFRASASFGAPRTTGHSAGSAAAAAAATAAVRSEDCAGTAEDDRIARLSPASADVAAAAAAAYGGGERDGCGCSCGGKDPYGADCSRRSLAVSASTAPTSLFFTQVRIGGGAPRMVPVDPRSPGFRNLDEPLLPLPPPLSPQRPAAAAAAAGPSMRRALTWVPRSEPLLESEPGPLGLEAGGLEPGERVAALCGSAVVVSSSALPPSVRRPVHARPLQSSPLSLDELQLPVRLSPLSPPRPPLSPPSPLPRQLLPQPSEDGLRRAELGGDVLGGAPPPGVLPQSLLPSPPPLRAYGRPRLVSVVRPSDLCAALPPVCRTPPQQLLPHRRGSTPGGGGGGTRGGADGDVDCGSWHSGSEAASATGLCSVASGLSVQFPYPVSIHDTAGAQGYVAGQDRSSLPVCTDGGCVPAAAVAAAAEEVDSAVPTALVDAWLTPSPPLQRVRYRARHYHQQQRQQQQPPPQQQQQRPQQLHTQLQGNDAGGAAAVAVRVPCLPPRSHGCAREVPFLPSACIVTYGEDTDGARAPYPPPPRLSYEKVFRFTGETGSCMTMAPEVFLTLPYNEKADVFSFGVLMYELFSRSLLTASYIGVKRPELPFVFTRCDQYTELVARGFRPMRPGAVPDPIWSLITECWDQDPVVRPHMSDVVQRLQEITAAARPQLPAAAAAERSRLPSLRRRGSAGGGRAAAACFRGVGGRESTTAAVDAGVAKDGTVSGPGGGIPAEAPGGMVVAADSDDSGGRGGRDEGGAGCLPRCHVGCVIC